MGRPKQLLPWPPSRSVPNFGSNKMGTGPLAPQGKGDSPIFSDAKIGTVPSKPLVAAAFDAIARVCDEMFVVLGHGADDVLTALEPRRFRSYVFDNPSAEMFPSVRMGLTISPAACGIDESAEHQFLLQLADHPEVRHDTLEAIITTADAIQGRAVMPQFRGRGGHPVLIPPNVAKLICGYEGEGGLRQFWFDHPELCVRLPVDDAGVVFDVDTQSDYDFRVQ